MAKPTKYAALICLILMIFVAIMAYVGYNNHSAILIVIGLLPVVVYEVYRTEGESTRSSSWIMLFVLLAEAALILFEVNFDIASWLGQSDVVISGSVVRLGDIKVLAPALMALMSVVLFVRTAGIYTKWLAIIIFVVSFVLIYTISPEAFSSLLKSSVNQVFYWMY